LVEGSVFSGFASIGFDSALVCVGFTVFASIFAGFETVAFVAGFVLFTSVVNLGVLGVLGAAGSADVALFLAVVGLVVAVVFVALPVSSVQDKRYLYCWFGGR
jgi:uncharacterized MnhB-related membrane protein